MEMSLNYILLAVIWYILWWIELHLTSSNLFFCSLVSTICLCQFDDAVDADAAAAIFAITIAISLENLY